jgi:hypothetical protein
MTLRTFIKKHKLPDSLTVDHIAIKHPKTGEKIYVVSQWCAGVWYRKKKGSAGSDGQMWPLQVAGGDVGSLNVHSAAKKELVV